jgi:hypothetical protein
VPYYVNEWHWLLIHPDTEKYRKKILSNKPKQSNNKKIAWILAGVAIAWYVISMFTMWK